MNTRGRPRTGDTIPKLDKIEYLFQALVWIGEERSFDELRVRLIKERLELDRHSRTDLRPEARGRVRVLENPTPDTFWTNARDAVRELMRLGMVGRLSVPNTRKEFQDLRGVRYDLTEEGRRFILLGEVPETVWEFRDRFYCAMDAAHPYLRLLRRRLGKGELFIPRVGRAAISGDVKQWVEAPPEPLDDVASQVTGEIAKHTDQRLDADEFRRLLGGTLNGIWQRRKPTEANKGLSRWVVKTVNDSIVQVVAHMNGLAIDFMALRYAVSLLSGFHICWGTRALSDRLGAWTIWRTADGEGEKGGMDESPAKMALEQPVWIKRRIVDERTVARSIIETILNKGGFSLIHEVRALVCYGLRIHGWVFNDVLKKMVMRTLRDDEYDAHVDSGGSGNLLPSEEAFLIGDKPYYLVSLLKRRSQ